MCSAAAAIPLAMYGTGLSPQVDKTHESYADFMTFTNTGPSDKSHILCVDMPEP